MTRQIHSIFLKVGATEYSGLVSDVNVPGLDPEVWEGSTDDNLVADLPVGKRNLVITARQDWHDEAGLCETMRAGSGGPATIIYSHNPDPAAGPWWRVTVPVLSDPMQGGKVNQFGEFTATMPCSRPERLSALPA